MTVKSMKPLALLESLAPLQSSIVRWVGDKRGVAAVEFAFVVPLMLVMFFGTVEFSSGVAVDRKISLVTQGLADLVSRYPSVNGADIANFTTIANAMLTPYSATPLNATMSELYIDPSTGAARVQWSRGSAPRAISSSVSVPANLIARNSATNAIVPNQYLIFIEANYLYTPAVGYVMAKTGVTLSDETYTRPRLSQCVIYPTPPAGTSLPNCPTS
jgi:Flp pilus assembly protein TadG